MVRQRSTGRLGITLAAATLALSGAASVVSALPGATLPLRVTAATLTLAAVSLAAGVTLLRRDPDGARARWGGDIFRGAAVLLGFVTLSMLHRPAAFAPPPSPRDLFDGFGPGLAAAALSVGVSRLLARDSAGASGRLAAGLALTTLLALVGASVTLRQRERPEDHVAALEVFARLPAFRDVPSLRRAEPWTQRVVPLGRFFLLQRCPGTRCVVWLTPRLDGDLEPSPSSLPPESVGPMLEDQRELTVRLDAARGLIAVDDGVRQLLFDREGGDARPAGWDQLRPAPAPPARWILVASLGWALAVAAAWSSRRSRAAEPVEAELRVDGALVHQGAALPLATPPGLTPGPVLLWLDGNAPASHYRDARTVAGARVEAGTLAIYRANAVSRAVARQSLVTALVLLSASPLVAWGIASLPPRPRAATTSRRHVEDGGLIVEDLRLGTGAAVRNGARVSVHYTGQLADGRVFDSSRGRDPFTFTTGARMVIEGFERGVAGMRVGGRRRVTIPAALGYGDRGHPPTIPERATLVFDLELLAVE